MDAGGSEVVLVRFFNSQNGQALGHESSEVGAGAWGCPGLCRRAPERG